VSLAKHFLCLNIQVFCPKRDSKSFRKIVEGVFFKATENYFAGVHFMPEFFRTEQKRPEQKALF